MEKSVTVQHKELKQKFGFRKRDVHLGREDDIIFLKLWLMCSAGHYGQSSLGKF